MASFIDSLKDLVGMNDEYEDDEYYQDQPAPVIEERSMKSSYSASSAAQANKRRSANVVNMPNPNTIIKICIHEPIDFDEVQNVIDDLLEGKAIVLNIEQLGTDVQQRIIDFVNGAVYALKGNTKMVTKTIFILAPKNVEVDNLKDAFETKGLNHF